MSSLTVAAAAAQLLSETMKALSAVRERAQKSKDSDLKERISALYNNFLSLQEALLRLMEENKELRHKQAQRTPEPELRQVGAVNYLKFWMVLTAPNSKPKA